MLEGEKDVLGLDFADLGFKEVHAGHLFNPDHAIGASGRAGTLVRRGD
jgi:hypothetical protein